MTALLQKAFGVLLMLSALALVLTRAPDWPPEALVARWAPPPSDFVDVGGQVVHLRDEGPRDDPLPVVLLHGMASSLHTWEGWAAGLRGQRRVITLDLPGFGLTGPNAAADYHVDSDARFVLRLLDLLRVRRAVIGGNSLGGDVALRIAQTAPGRVAALVLVDAVGFPFEPAAVPLALRMAQLPIVGLLFENVLPRPLVAQSLQAAYGHADRVTPERVDRVFELLLRAGNRRALVERLAQLRRDAAADSDDSAAARLRALAVPTLLLWGGQDRIVPPAVAQRLHAAIADSRLVVIDDLGHLPHEEDPARSLAPVREFLGLR